MSQRQESKGMGMNTIIGAQHSIRDCIQHRAHQKNMAGQERLGTYLDIEREAVWTNPDTGQN